MRLSAGKSSCFARQLTGKPSREAQGRLVVSLAEESPDQQAERAGIVAPAAQHAPGLAFGGSIIPAAVGGVAPLEEQMPDVPGCPARRSARNAQALLGHAPIEHADRRLRKKLRLDWH